MFVQLRRTGDAALREALVHRYLPLARNTARRFQRHSDSLEDLYQVASYALVKAVDGFDASRGLAFTSYAVPTINGELKRYARDTGWGLRVPRGLQEKILEVDRAIADLTAQLGRSPTAAQIATATGLSTEEVLETLEAAHGHALESLDMPAGTDAEGLTRLDTVGDVDPQFERVDDLHALAPVMRGLPERERQILALRFGEELSQAEIARRLEISQMHVSRLLRHTLDEVAERVEAPALAS